MDELAANLDGLETESTTAFTGETYEDFVEWFPGSDLENQMKSFYESRGEEYTGIPELPPYDKNEEGQYVNDDGERLYYFSGSDMEASGSRAGLGTNYSYMTKDDIQEAYNSDPMLGVAFADFDTFWNYTEDRQAQIDSGVILDQYEQNAQIWADQFMRTRDGRGGPQAQLIDDIVGGEASRDAKARTGKQKPLYRNSTVLKYSTLTRWGPSISGMALATS